MFQQLKCARQKQINHRSAYSITTSCFVKAILLVDG